MSSYRNIILIIERELSKNMLADKENIWCDGKMCLVKIVPLFLIIKKDKKIKVLLKKLIGINFYWTFLIVKKKLTQICSWFSEIQIIFYSFYPIYLINFPIFTEKKIRKFEKFQLKFVILSTFLFSLWKFLNIINDLITQQNHPRSIFNVKFNGTTIKAGGQKLFHN